MLKSRHHTFPLIPIFLLFALFLMFLYFVLRADSIKKQEAIKSISTFEECKSAGFPIMESFPEQCRTSEGKSFTNYTSGQKISIEGTPICLEHKKKDGPQTLECAFGIKDHSGKMFALSDPSMRFITTFSMGKEIKIEGVFKNITSDKYDAQGTIEIIKVLPSSGVTSP